MADLLPTQSEEQLDETELEELFEQPTPPKPSPVGVTPSYMSSATMGKPKPNAGNPPSPSGFNPSTDRGGSGSQPVNPEDSFREFNRTPDSPSGDIPNQINSFPLGGTQPARGKGAAGAQFEPTNPGQKNSLDGVQAKPNSSNPSQLNQSGFQKNAVTAGKGAAGAAAGKQVAAKVGKGANPAAGAVDGIADKIKERFGGENSTIGKVTNFAAGIAKDATDVGTLIASGGLNVVAWWSIISRRWYIFLAAELIPAVAIFVICLILGVILGRVFGSRPAGIAFANTAADSPSNPGGEYCAEMKPTITSANGQLLVMPTLRGKWSKEDAAYSPGRLNNKKKSPLAYFDSTRADTGKKGFSDEELKYYATARWPYRGWYFSGVSEPRTVPNSGRLFGQFAGQHVMFYSPKYGKAAVAVVAEAGPAPWTGTGAQIVDNSRQKGDENSTRYNPDNIDQRIAWQGATRPVARIDAPANYNGNIAGGPPALAKALGGLDVPDDIIIGFVPLNTPLGPATCTKITKTTPVKQGKPNAQVLSVPLVEEGKNSNTCTYASPMMVNLFYNKSFSDDDYLVKDKTRTKSTAGDKACPDVTYLNNKSGKSDWVTKKSSEVKAESIVASITGGDPIIFYPKKGLVVPGARQTVVISGYNKDDGSFLINSPYNGKSERSWISKDQLSKFSGDDSWGYSYIIRSSYAK